MPSEAECLDIQESMAILSERYDEQIVRFESHAVMVAELKDDFHEHKEVEDNRHTDFMTATRLNTEAINKLSESTEDMVGAWQSATGAIKVGSIIGKFIKWAAGFAIVGALFNHFGGN